MKLATSILCTVLGVSSVASAQAPPPGDESGRLDDTQPEDSGSRKVGRAVLAIPRYAIHLVLAPFRLGLWAYEHYDVAERAHELFYTESDTLSILPVLSYETDIGLRLGAQLDYRFVNKDRLRLFAGSSLQGSNTKLAGSYAAHLGERVTAEAGGQFERRPNDHFYGIGNMDLTGPPPMPVDATDIAVDTEYKNRLVRATAMADTRIFGDFYLRASGALSERQREVGNSGPDIEMVYVPFSLVGFDKYRSVYGELDARWDSRYTASKWDAPGVISGGSLVSFWGGPSWVTVGQNFWRYGTDLQYFLRLGNGPRVLSARFHGEAVTAQREEVPFTELSTLGGSVLLRGYHLDRFRDRIAGVGTLEYTWDLSRYLFGSVFADSGRVFSAYQNLTFADLRTGFGVALELHTPSGRLGRVSMSSSVDGGVFFNFYFEPVFAVVPRVERR